MSRFITSVFVLFSIIALSAITFANSIYSDSVGKEKIMPLVYVGNAGVSNEDESRNILYEAITRELSKYNNLEMTDIADNQGIFEEYLLENDLNPDDTALGRGYIPKKIELNEMAQQVNADYVLLINARITDAKEKVAWLSFAGTKFEVTVLYTVLVYSVKENKYVYNEKYIVKENAAGTSSTERAFKKACIKFAEKEFNLDKMTLTKQSVLQ